MMKQLWNLITGRGDDSAAVLDHIPVNRYEPQAKPAPVKPVGTTPEQAKARHGKPFKAHVLVARETPLSRDLVEMNELSAKNAANTVTTITKRARG